MIDLVLYFQKKNLKKELTMRRRSALKAIAAAALTAAGCQCIIKKEVPEIQPVDMYWDDINKRWINFQQIEFSSSMLVIKINNDREFKFTNNACLIIDKNHTVWLPMYDASKPKFPKNKFIDGVNNDFRNNHMKKDYVGQYYEVTHKDLNLHNILYM